MSSQLNKLAVVHWALIAGNNGYTFNRMYNELHDPDILSVVHELQEIQSHLNDLELWFRDPRIERLMQRELNDIEIGITACSTSISKLNDIVKSVTSDKRGEPISRVWGEIRAKFKELEGPVVDRMNAHRVWLTQLFPILKMHFIFSKPQSRMEVDRLRSQIRYVNGADDQELYEQRAREWEEYHRRVAEHARLARVAQPPSPQYSPTMFVPMAPWSAQATPAMYSPPQSGSSYSPRYSVPGAAPGYFHSYPSPPTSNSSTNSPQSSRPPRTFTIHYPSQPIRPTTPTYQPNPVEEDYPQKDFDSDMTVALYRNKETNAARIVCAVDHVGSWVNDQRGGSPYQGSIKIVALTVRRESKHILNLVRSKHLWARLVFSDFENMVLFFNTFIALRAHSPAQDHPNDITSAEKWLAGESSKWSCYVYYDNDTYQLHLLQDEETRCVRIAAMHHQPGPLDNMTIWTVFIHEQMGRGVSWFKQVSSTVILPRIPVAFFSTSFALRPVEEFALKFLNINDANRFIEEIEDLSRNY
ncbi:hypothetical protein BDZ91DRAFT_796749 [Kalaharituber pfeilii]|nr:hypothetical protein BDZ91DRAFT_796749 [Kalaharituber pfeilii]